MNASRLEETFGFTCVWLTILNEFTTYMNGLGWIGYDCVQVILFCVLCLACSDSFVSMFYLTFRMVKIELPATGRQETWDQTRFETRRLDMPELRSQCLRLQVPSEKWIFRTFFRCFLGFGLQRIPVRNVNFWKPFFAYHGVPMATQKKQHIISLYERYLKTTQPSTWNGWSNHLQKQRWHL